MSAKSLLKLAWLLNIQKLGLVLNMKCLYVAWVIPEQFPELLHT